MKKPVKPESSGSARVVVYAYELPATSGGAPSYAILSAIERIGGRFVGAPRHVDPALVDTDGFYVGPPFAAPS
ncbi:MAG: hypothetical protein QM718_05665 [Steroidobacteraceae bacterium]